MMSVSLKSSGKWGVSAAAAALACAGLVACGGSGGGSGEVLARVGETPITRSAVSHWMGTLAGGDYYELSGNHTLPAGIVSDPPNYAQCVARLQAADASNPRASSVSPSELLTKCREINLALRIQAESYLLESQSLISVAHAEGITASEPDVQQLFSRIRAEQYPSTAELNRYLTSKRTSLADLLFVVKLDVLRQKETSKLTAGGKHVEAQFLAAQRQLAAQTSCNAGYVVHGCSQFKSEHLYPGSLSPAILMEQVAALVTGRCINQQACGKV